jgi:hypothetical protein
MDHAHSAVNAVFRLFHLVDEDGADRAHDPGELYAEFLPDAHTLDAHELAGIVTRADRYRLILCCEGRVYAIGLRQGTAVIPAGQVIEEGAFVSVHGWWTNATFQATHITLA